MGFPLYLPSDLSYLDRTTTDRACQQAPLHSRMSLGSLTEKDLKGAIDEAAAEAAAACAAMSQGGNYQDEDEVAVAVRAGAPRHPDNVWWCGVTVTLPLIPTYPLRAGCGGRGGSVSGHGTGHDDRGRR